MDSGNSGEGAKVNPQAVIDKEVLDKSRYMRSTCGLPCSDGPCAATSIQTI
jgi:hypothetical protein